MTSRTPPKFVLIATALFVFGLRSAFSQPLAYTPIVDFGDVPIGIDSVAALFCQECYVENLSSEPIDIFNVRITDSTGPNTLQVFNGELYQGPLRLRSHERMYFVIEYMSLKTGSVNARVRVAYRERSGHTDTGYVPVVAHSTAASEPFLNSLVAGTVFFCQPSGSAGHMTAGLGIFNPTQTKYQVDSIERIGDTSDFEFHWLDIGGTTVVPYYPFQTSPGGVPPFLSVTFQPQDTGLRRLTLRVFLSAPQGGAKVLETVLTGHVIFEQALTAWGYVNNIVYTNVKAGDCDTSARADILNCGDTAAIDIGIIGDHKSDYTVWRHSTQFTMLGGDVLEFSLRFCPLAARSDTFDSLIITAQYPSGERDTQFVQIYSRVPPPSGVFDMPESPLLDVMAFPNPFRMQTNIHVGDRSSEIVRVSVIDLLGREVSVLANTHQQVQSTMEWSPDATLPAGAYMVALQTRGGIVYKPVTLVR